MKNLHILFLIIFALSLSTSAQQLPFEDNTSKIAKFESKSYHNHPCCQTRLGGNIDMVYSRFEWEIDPGVLFIRGCVTSYFVAKAHRVSEIDLELNNNMVIDSIIFRGENVSHEYFSEFQFKINLGLTLNEADLDSLKIYYQGVPDSGSGFGSFMKDEHNGVPILWTLSEPFGAKAWWPGKNDLNDKIDSIDVYVTTPMAYRVASHGLLISEVIHGTNKVHHWKHRYPIVSYLVAIAVTNYAQFTNYAILDGDSLPILNYVFPEDSATVANQTKNTYEMLQLFDTLFGTYPFEAEKYGQAQFLFGGGMEHQTMSFMSYYSHDLRAHELAHSWFGNKITLASWHDVFLNEGFATYATGLSYEHMINGFYWDIWKSNTRNAALSEPGGSVYVEDTTSVDRIFNARLSYHKGAYLLHMLRGIMGDESFYEALRNYVADPVLAYRFATLDDLKFHLESVGEIDFTEFFDDWYYGEGYPNYGINVAQMEEDNKIHITVFQDQSHPSVDYFEMPVPMVVYGNGTSKTLICNNTYSGEEYIFEDPGFSMDSVKFDPEQWILAKLDFLNLGIANGETHVLEIHPNPAVDEIRFFIPNKKVQDVEIFDIGGRMIIRSKPNTINEFIKINISELSAGVYFIKAFAENHYFEGKFIKQ